jgi:hypothetical protein
MILALLAVLGMDLIVIAVLLAGVLGRRRWASRQPDAFRGAIWVTNVSASIPPALGALASDDTTIELASAGKIRTSSSVPWAREQLVPSAAEQPGSDEASPPYGDPMIDCSRRCTLR